MRGSLVEVRKQSWVRVFLFWNRHALVTHFDFDAKSSFLHTDRDLYTLSLPSPSTYYCRHPSALLVVHVQLTHIPGLPSSSKPHPVTPCFQQQHQNNNHQCCLLNNRPEPTSNARVFQPTIAVAAVQLLLSEGLSKLSTPGRPTTKPHPAPVTSSVTPEKPLSPHGRQNLEHCKDKSKKRYVGDGCGRDDI